MKKTWKRCYEPEPRFWMSGNQGQSFAEIYCQRKRGHEDAHRSAGWEWDTTGAHGRVEIPSLIRLAMTVACPICKADIGCACDQFTAPHPLPFAVHFERVGAARAH